MKCTKCNKFKIKDDFYKSKNKVMSECKECHKERMRLRCRKSKDFIYSIVGNVCSICGYDKCEDALELHHLDPSKKEFNISKSRSYSKEKILKEIEKCILVCANCHRELHSKETKCLSDKVSTISLKQTYKKHVNLQNITKQNMVH